MIRPGDIYEWSKVDRTAISLSELRQHVKKERCDEFWIEPEQFGPLAAQLIEMDRLHHPKKSYVAPQEITVLGARIMVRGWH